MDKGFGSEGVKTVAGCWGDLGGGGGGSPGHGKGHWDSDTMKRMEKHDQPV